MMTGEQLNSSLANSPIIPPIAADDVQAIRDLKHQMMAKARLLNDSIDDAIAEAPLPQRISALTQLVDRIVLLGHQLPTEPETYEYELEDSEGEEPRRGEVEIETSESLYEPYDDFEA